MNRAQLSAEQQQQSKAARARLGTGGLCLHLQGFPSPAPAQSLLPLPSRHRSPRLSGTHSSGSQWGRNEPVIILWLESQTLLLRLLTSPPSSGQCFPPCQECQRIGFCFQANQEWQSEDSDLQLLGTQVHLYNTKYDLPRGNEWKTRISHLDNPVSLSFSINY